MKEKRTQLNQVQFNIHGDNIVECTRAFNYIVESLSDAVREIIGPKNSITCPMYIAQLENCSLTFQFLPGYGKRRWNQDITDFVKQSGGHLREAADAIVTRIENGIEKPVIAIEFCGALPAGNQAWQRHGRAFSFAHAKIPFFYIAELGGFELGINREPKAKRMPNPAIPFSFLAMTRYRRSVCLPVYEANSGATDDTIERYGPIFGKPEFLKFLKLAVLGMPTDRTATDLGYKCVALVELLANSRKRQDGLTGDQWKAAYEAVLSGENLADFLFENGRLSWKKKAFIASLTESARQFMDLGAARSFGLASSTLPLSFVPKSQRTGFSRKAREIYPDLGDDFSAWLANGGRHLAIAWVMGFKPQGNDARPDRGLPPLARMLVGDECELMTFVYGPVPVNHWNSLAENPVELAASNGLWEAVLSVSDGVLIDSATKPSSTPRSYMKDSWATVLNVEQISLCVEAKVLCLGEQDVDTALHVAFESLGTDVVFEGMCNPPGGDWSGISFLYDDTDVEYRWLTLPRVSADGAKRPDHVFALFGHGDKTVCLCIESKEKARSLEENIGPRLRRYTETLFEKKPSIYRNARESSWKIYNSPWEKRDLVFVSAGAYLSDPSKPFKGLPIGTALDIQIGVVFSSNGQSCTLHLRGDTDAGKALVNYLAALPNWSTYVTIVVNN